MLLLFKYWKFLLKLVSNNPCRKRFTFVQAWDELHVPNELIQL